MRKITISDITLKQKESKNLTFRQRLELVKILDSLNVGVIELPPIENRREDSLFIKSALENIKNARICVTTENPTHEEIDALYALTEKTNNRRIQIALPVSSVQMEYFFQKKAPAMLEYIRDSVSYAKSKTGWEVELVLKDSTRADRSVLLSAIEENIQADVITVCDDDSSFLPADFAEFLRKTLPVRFEKDGSAVLGTFSTNIVPGLGKAPNTPEYREIYDNFVQGKTGRFGVCVTNSLRLADINSVTALSEEVTEIKTQCISSAFAGTENVVKIIEAKQDKLGCCTDVKTIEIRKSMNLIKKLYTEDLSRKTPFQDGVRENRESRSFTEKDDISSVSKEIQRLGYSLSSEELEAVYKVFKETSRKKDTVHTKDLEAIIASLSTQVPQTYTLEHYIINTGNTISSTGHIKMRKDNEVLEEVSVGDGPIDASFLAIEKITGHHYELDDFQVQTVSEGREAMGEALVKIRANGKIYSGRGVSTDIIASSIIAYVNALNKIEYDAKNTDGDNR